MGFSNAPCLVKLGPDPCAVVVLDVLLVEKSLHGLLCVLQKLFLEVLTLDCPVDGYVSDVCANFAIEARAFAKG